MKGALRYFFFFFFFLLFSLKTADTCYLKLGTTDTPLFPPDFILLQVAPGVTGAVPMSFISPAMNGAPRYSFSLPSL